MADFSKKHYVIIAKVINDALDGDKQGDNFNTAKGIAVQLAGIFGADNPQFDWHRFYTACGLDADKLLSEEA